MLMVFWNNRPIFFLMCLIFFNSVYANEYETRVKQVASDPQEPKILKTGMLLLKSRGKSDYSQ